MGENLIFFVNSFLAELMAPTYVNIRREKPVEVPPLPAEINPTLWSPFAAPCWTMNGLVRYARAASELLPCLERAQELLLPASFYKELPLTFLQLEAAHKTLDSMIKESTSPLHQHMAFRFKQLLCEAQQRKFISSRWR